MSEAICGFVAISLRLRLRITNPACRFAHAGYDAAVHESVAGTNRPPGDVSNSVAIGGESRHGADSPIRSSLTPERIIEPARWIDLTRAP
jgi:hypothetical protein